MGESSADIILDGGFRRKKRNLFLLPFSLFSYALNQKESEIEWQWRGGAPHRPLLAPMRRPCPALA